MSKVSAIQLNSGPNIKVNLYDVKTYVEQISDTDSKMVVLPENFALMPENDNDYIKNSEKLDDGPIQNNISKLASANNIWIVAGTIPIKSDDKGLVVHRAVLNDITGTSTLLDWLSDGHAAIVELGRLIKRDTEFNSALSSMHTFIEGDLGGQIIQLTDTRLMLLPPGCRGLKGVEMEAFAASAEELGRRRL